MASKITLALNPKQVEELAEQLDTQAKIRLIKKLEQETWANELDTVVRGMRKRVRIAGISDRKIERICEEVKREYDEKHRRH